MDEVEEDVDEDEDELDEEAVLDEVVAWVDVEATAPAVDVPGMVYAATAPKTLRAPRAETATPAVRRLIRRSARSRAVIRAWTFSAVRMGTSFGSALSRLWEFAERLLRETAQPATHR